MKKSKNKRKILVPAKKDAGAVDIRDAQWINKSLLEDSLVFAATQQGINEDFDLEERERMIECRPSAKRAKK